MKIPFLNLKLSDREVEAEIKNSVLNIIERKDFILGKEVVEFEKEFANFVGTKFAVGVSSGTAALLVSLKSLGIKNGDKVLTTPFTFTATGEVIVHCGATPVFFDIDEKTYNIDLQKVEKYLSSIDVEKEKIKVILPVHLYGLPADMKKLSEISKKYGLKIVEDCAQSHGAKIKVSNTQWQKVGSFGDTGCFSFYPTKNLGGYGDGGMITVNDEILYKEILKFRNHGRVEHYLHQILGYNARLDNLQAGILLQKLKFIEKWNKQRQQIASWYYDGLKGVGDIVLPFVPDGYEHVYHLFVIRTKYRDKLIEYLKQNEIGCAVQYAVPLHLQPAYQKVCEIATDMKVVEKVSKEVLSLPIYPGLKKEEIDFVVTTIKNFFDKNV
jgi:dTDP-4-amino-4,6-dideoxygalactose transaminase